MDTLLIILATIAVDWGIGGLINKHKKAKQSKDIHTFDRQLGHIFNSKMSMKKKLEEAKDLCRNTVGDESVGAYFLIDHIQNHIS